MNPDAYMLFYIRQDVENVDLATLFSPDSEGKEGKEEIGEITVEGTEDGKKCCIL